MLKGLKISALLIASALAANALTLSQTDRGIYGSNFATGTANKNYFVGATGDTYLALPSDPSYLVRNFFIFDLGSVTPGSIVSATLRLFNPTPADGNTPNPFDANEDLVDGYVSPDAFEEFVIRPVSTAVATLESRGGTALTVYNDLGTGTVFGSAVVSSADNGQFVEVTFNAAGLAALNAATGKIAFGGSLGSATYPFTGNAAVAEYVFSGAFEGTSELVMTVPEPSTYAAVAGVLALALAFLRRRAK